MSRRALLLATALGVAGAAFLAPAGAWAQIVLEGRVVDASGAPVVNADIDLFEAESGRKLDLSGQDDNSDVDGTFALVVNPDIYHVRAEPPPGRDELAPVEVRDVLAATDTSVDLVLPLGIRLAGRVTGPGGGPVVGVDLDVTDAVTGIRAPTVNDDTDADGRFSFAVEPGTYTVSLSPPAGSGAGPVRTAPRDLTADTVLDVTLPRGWTVRGRIVDGTGRTLPGIDLDAEVRAGRRSVPLSGDTTGFDGLFAVVVPEGELDFFAVPPPSAPFAPAVRRALAVTTDLDLGDVVLEPGLVLSGTVRDPGGAPVVGADLDLFVAGGCDAFPSPTGETDASGTFSVRVPAGPWDVRVTPAAGGALPVRRFLDLPVAADTTVELHFPTEPLPTEPVSGRVLDPGGAPAAGVLVEGEPLAGGAAWSAVTDADGTFSAVAAEGPWRLRLTPPLASDLPTTVVEPVELPCAMPPALSLVERGTGPGPQPVPSTLPVQAFPNPWRESTTIGLALASPRADAVVEVFDVLGRRVRTLSRGALPGGDVAIPWDGTDEAGRPVATGIYFVSVRGAGPLLAGKIARIAP